MPAHSTTHMQPAKREAQCSMRHPCSRWSAGLRSIHAQMGMACSLVPSDDLRGLTVPGMLNRMRLWLPPAVQ